MNLFEKLLSMVSSDVVEVFGPSGSGKSTFCYLVVQDALKQGKKAHFLDTERNLVDVPNDSNLTYYYTPDYNMILNFARNLPQADLYVLDSLGMSVLPMYAEAPMDQKGRMLLKSVSLMSYYKLATYKNKALAIVTNQPVSEFGKPNVNPEDLRPWGDKSIFLVKEVFRTSIVERSPERTVCEVRAWRSRRFGFGKTLFRLFITDKGVNVECLV